MNEEYSREYLKTRQMERAGREKRDAEREMKRAQTAALAAVIEKNKHGDNLLHK